MTKATNLQAFVVHSPFQLFMAEHIVQSLPTETQGDRWLVIDSWQQAPDFDPALWNKITVISPGLGPCVTTNGRPRLKLVNQIEEVLLASRQARLWLANVQWPLNNVLFRRLQTAGLQHVQHVNYPEGIGSLLCPRPDIYQRVRDIVKATTRLTGGSGYHPYTCDLMGVAAADFVFTLLPEVVIPRTRGTVVPIPMVARRRVMSSEKTIVFVGQNYDDHLPVNVYQSLCRDAARFATSLGHARFLYKPHHYTRSTIERDALREFGFESLTLTGPVETYLTENAISAVVSYNSSALVHAKLMLGEAIEAYACFADEIQPYLRQDPTTMSRMKQLFDRCGVRQIERNHVAGPVESVTGKTYHG